MSLPRRNLTSRQMLSLAAAAALRFSFHEQPATADVTESWALDGSGSWNVAANWSPNTNYPNNGTPAGTNYQAVVALPGSAAYTVTATTNLSVDNLLINSTNATVSENTGTLTIAGMTIDSGVFKLAGGTLSGGAAGATVILNSPGEINLLSGTLNNVTFAGSNLTASPTGIVHVSGGLNLSGGTLELTPSGGLILFDGSSETIDDLTVESTSSTQSTLYVGSTSSFSSATLTLGTSAITHGNIAFSNGPYISHSLTNDGLMYADAGSQTLSISTAAFTNNAMAQATNSATLLINANNWTNAVGATISVDASTLTLAGTWTNSGTISATNGSVVNFGGTFTSANLASVSVSADGTINLTGTLNNSGNTLTLSASPPLITLKGGTISGGNVAFGNNLNILSGTLAGVTVPSGGSISVTPAGTINLTGSWSNQGSIAVGVGGVLNLAGTFGPSSVGTITASPTASVNLTGTVNNTGATLTFSGVSQTVTVAGGTISGGDIATGNLLQVSSGTITGSTIDSNTTVNLLTGGALTLTGSCSNQGTINVVPNSTLLIAGTVATPNIGTINVSPGSLAQITGTINNTGSTLTFSTAPLLTLTGGTISGGNVSFGNNLNISVGTLNGVTVPSGGAIGITAGGTLNMAGSWTNQGTITLGTGSVLNLGGSFPFSAIGMINDAAGTVNITGSLDNTGNTLTLAGVSSPWKLTSGGAIGNGSVATGANLSIVNGMLINVLIPAGASVNVAPGGTATLYDPSNQGTVVLGANSNFTLGGTVIPTAVGNIVAPASATINIGGTLQNSNSTFTLAPQATTWAINGGLVVGGTIAASSPNQTLSVNSGTLDGVTFQGLSPISPNLTSLTIKDGLSGAGQNFYLGGTALVSPNIYFVSPTQQLSNLNFVKANTTGASRVGISVGPTSGSASAQLIIGPDASITATVGAVVFGQVLGTNSTITNNGTISANASTGTVQLSFLPILTNNGTISASNGGTFYVDNTSAITNSGLIKSDSGTLTLTANVFQNAVGGTIDATNHSQLTISSSNQTGTNSGTITIDNSNASITGSWFNNSQSIINVINGGSLFCNVFNNQLSGGIFNLLGGNLTIPQSLRQSLTGTLSGSGTINTNGGFGSALVGNFDFNVGGTVQRVNYDSYTFNGAFGLNGHLAVALTNDFAASITAGEQFVLVNASSVFTPVFNNVSNGGRLATADGLGSFQVNYGTGQYADELVLTNFQLSASEPWTNAAGNSTWDTGVSANWSVNSASTVFHTGDVVTFNDSNSGAYNVTLNTTVTPGNVVFNNSAGDYIVSGSGGIAGTGALYKFGSRTVTLDTLNSYTGGTAVSAGELIIGTAGALPDGAVYIPGGTLQLAPGIGPSQLTSLAISASAVLDITNNRVVINYGSGPDPIASIAALIASGYANGTWTGAGITSSTAQGNSSSYGIGFADSADPGNPANLASGTIEIIYTLLGDANLDGKVNGTDFAILATNFNQAVTNWDQGDFNYDNKVNGSDFAYIASNFNQGASQSAAATLLAFAEANGLMADVPEPVAGGAAVVAGFGVMMRRMRKARG